MDDWRQALVPLTPPTAQSTEDWKNSLVPLHDQPSQGLQEPDYPESVRAVGALEAQQKEEEKNLALYGGLSGLLTAGLGPASRALLTPLRVPGPLAAGVGEFTGAMIGGKLSGQTPKEALANASLAAGIGVGAETGVGIASRVLGATTGLPKGTVGRTLRKPFAELTGNLRKPVRFPAGQTMFGQPPEMAERTLGTDILDRLEKANKTISPGRLTKIDLRNQAQQMGLTVPLNPLRQAIDSGIAEAGTAVGRANSAALARLQSLKDGLDKAFPTGDLTPQQADAQLQAFQRDADMASARGNPFLAQTYRSLKSALRDSFFKSVDAVVPGSDMAAATARAKNYLDSIDTLGSFVKDKTPETFVRGLFANEQPAQSALQALRDFETEMGTDGMLEKQIHDLALKREWTRGEQGRGFSLWRAIEKIIAKPLTKVGILFARPAGQMAAAATAFSQAMSTKDQPNP